MVERIQTPENIETEIERLLGELQRYALDQFPEEIQDQLAQGWYDAEMEAIVGTNRDEALGHLRAFVDLLGTIPKKSKF